MFTTQCSGDLGIEVEGRVVAQAFIHLDPNSTHIHIGQATKLHVYDLVRGGLYVVLPIDAGLEMMLAIARRES